MSGHVGDGEDNNKYADDLHEDVGNKDLAKDK